MNEPESDFKVLDVGRILRWMLLVLGAMALLFLVLLGIAYLLGRF